MSGEERREGGKRCEGRGERSVRSEERVVKKMKLEEMEKVKIKEMRME